jgi:hypothetical protein
MRDFVRNILPQYQIRSPKMLGSSAEKELEQEIDNDNAKIVGGDGVASADMAAGREALVAGADVVESDGEDSKNSYPSWGRPNRWYMDSTDLGDSSMLDLGSPQPTTSDATLRRIKSLVLPNSSNHQLQRRTSHVLLTARKIQDMREPPPAYSAVPDDIMTPVSSPPPSPSIRRKQASHRDLTSIVNSYEQSGPANLTLRYNLHMTPSASSCTT